MRLLITSTLDSKQPFGAFTRPFYLGMYLSKQFDLCQLGLDCSSINYAKTVSVGSRSLKKYIEATLDCINRFQPDVIYAQETLPAISALIACKIYSQNAPRLVFDFHTLSAFEYWTRLSASAGKFGELMQFLKTYIAQGSLVYSNREIIAASQSTLDLLPKWYFVSPKNTYYVGNGVPEDLLNPKSLQEPSRYQEIRPAKIVLIISPKTFQFPTNDMAVEMTIQIASYLEKYSENLHFVVVGRSAEGINFPLPKNITFAGFLSRDEFVNHLYFSDVCLLPFPEKAVAGGARNKALDYLACQKIVVSTPEGLRGLEEFCHDQHLLVTDYSIEEIADTLLQISKEPEHYQSLALNAYKLVQAKYSWSAMADKVAAILKT